jgi:hypothetical protein
MFCLAEDKSPSINCQSCVVSTLTTQALAGWLALEWKPLYLLIWVISQDRPWLVMGTEKWICESESQQRACQFGTTRAVPPQNTLKMHDQLMCNASRVDSGIHIVVLPASQIQPLEFRGKHMMMEHMPSLQRWTSEIGRTRINLKLWVSFSVHYSIITLINWKFEHYTRSPSCIQFFLPAP